MQEERISTPLVSVAMAIYNGRNFLEEQLDSILAQTYKNLEVVVSDDGSDDGTTDILEAYSKKDARVRWSRSTRSRGLVPNFTEAVSLCKGDIVFFSDCDDVWFPDKVARHVEAYRDPSVQWVCNNVVITNPELKPVGYLTDYLPDYWTRRKFLYYTWGSCVIGCATSYRASVMKGRWPADPLSQGHDSWIQMAIYPAKRHYISEVLQDYRQHESNMTGIRHMTSNEKDVAKEAQAVRENMDYLKNLVRNNRLQLWKRGYLLLVVLGKQLRAKWREVRGSAR